MENSVYHPQCLGHFHLLKAGFVFLLNSLIPLFILIFVINNINFLIDQGKITDFGDKLVKIDRNYINLPLYIPIINNSKFKLNFFHF
jgi:hypothetical protein